MNKFTKIWPVPFFIICGIVIFSTVNAPWNDFKSNVGLGFTIGGVFLAVYIAVTIKQNTRHREIQEQQHYKERLLPELDRLVRLSSLVVEQDGDPVQKNAMLKNNSHAERSWTKLNSINSMFSVPSHIRRNFDELLSHYDATLEGANHGCLMIRDSKKYNSDMANEVKNFLNDDFFKNHNNEFIEKNYAELNEQLSKLIISNDDS